MSKDETILNEAEAVVLEAAQQSGLLYAIAKYLAWKTRCRSDGRCLLHKRWSKI